MAINFKDNGEFEIIYGKSWTGVNAQAPPNLIEDSDAVSMQGFILRNKELRSHPAMWASIPGVAGRIHTGVGTFLSPADLYHTFATASDGVLYNLSGLTTLTAIKTIFAAINTPIQWRVFDQILYIVNGSNYMAKWNGTAVNGDAGPITSWGVNAGGAGYAPGDTGTITGGGGTGATYTVVAAPAGVVATINITNPGSAYVMGTVGAATAVTTGGGNGALTIDIAETNGAQSPCAFVDNGLTPLGAVYLNTLDQHFLLANTTGNASDAPNTKRWSAVGLPTQFDPTLNVNAGFVQLVDTTDTITGLMTLGRVGYLFHRTGITEIDPTGIGTAPFDFNHIWNSPDGIGNVYPYSLAQYGQVGAFVAEDNIYMVQNYQFSAIGGNARDSIMADIYAASVSYVTNAVIGAIVPGYNNNYVYLLYQLYIVTVSGVILWEYSIEDKYWQRTLFSPSTLFFMAGVPFMCAVNVRP